MGSTQRRAATLTPDGKGIKWTMAERLKKILGEKGVSLQFLGDEAPHPIVEIETSTCRVACPARVNIKAYLGFIARGEFEKALSIVRETNPLPGICGRVCTHPCESECRRGDYDEPVAICALKRFIADYELKHRKIKIEPIPRTKKEKVAIIGSGPAGLTCANDLIRMGYGVTVFEELPVAGGMLVSGIPAYRLPRDIIQSEIEDIVRLGVEIKTNTRIEDPEGLLKEGFDAVFIAIGAHKGLKLKIPGEDEFKGIVDCITFLREVNLSKPKRPGNRVIVIGGGNSAIDSARSALRLGCEEVYIVYRRSRKEMPAAEEEIEAAEAEGVKIHYLAAPVRILGRRGRVVGVECTKMRLGEPDASGRRRPIPIEGSEFVIDCDFIIAAISQRPDLSFLKKGHRFKITRWDTFEVDEETLATNIPGIFAGGDAVTGPNTVIDAIAAGHTAARSIDRYLRKLPLKEEPRVPFSEQELALTELIPERKGRIRPRTIPLTRRRRSFAEVELTLTESEAIEEAKRCLRCGPCLDCISCVEHCHKRLLGVETSTERILIRVPYLPKEIASGQTWSGSLSYKGKRLEEVKITPIISTVTEELCRGCGRCEEVCPYQAVKVTERKDGILVAEVDRYLCRGCGVCGAICPTGAIRVRFFGDDAIVGPIRSAQVVVFACNWSGYPALQAAETAGFRIPKRVQVVHLICLGRLSLGHILQAFERGADSVILLGCEPDRCHYINGSLKAKEIFTAAQRLLAQLGLDPSRLRWESVRPDQAEKVKAIISGFRPVSTRRSARAAPGKTSRSRRRRR